jgi:hypothetical protein
MECLNALLADPDGRRHMCDVAFEYLWESGIGCRGENVWQWLPKDIVSLIIKIAGTEGHSLTTWCLLDRRTAVIALIHYPFSTDQIRVSRLVRRLSNGLNWLTFGLESSSDYVKCLIQNTSFLSASDDESDDKLDILLSEAHSEDIKDDSLDVPFIFTFLRLMTNRLKPIKLYKLAKYQMMQQNPLRDAESVTTCLTESVLFRRVSDLDFATAPTSGDSEENESLESQLNDGSFWEFYPTYRRLAEAYDITMPLLVPIDEAVDDYFKDRRRQRERERAEKAERDRRRAQSTADREEERLRLVKEGRIKETHQWCSGCGSYH